MPDQERHFHELLGLLLDDEISAGQMRELVRLVKGNPAFSRELRQQLSMDNRLAQHENESRSADRFVASIQEVLNAEDDADEFVDKVVRLADFAESAPTTQRAPWLVAALSLAACLALALVLFQRPVTVPENTTSVEPIDNGVAVVSSIVGKVVFQGNELEKGDVVEPGMLEFDSGYLALEFYRGARMTVGGPAKLEFIDGQKVRCHFGKVRAQVPPVAKGFTVLTPESQVVDLGTEFAVEVGKAGQTEIHVFDGEVEAYDVAGNPASKKLLTAGKALMVAELKEFPAEQARFNDLVDIGKKERRARRSRFEKWTKRSTQIRDDERLIAYYDFEADESQERTLINRSGGGAELNGAIVGATWTEGPWPGKGALNFKRPGDRVRINIPGEYNAITLSAWVRVDGIDRNHSSLLLTDGYEPGEVHWQFRKSGTLVAGVRHPGHGKNYTAENFVNLKRLGRWIHLATVINPDEATVTHYANGRTLHVAELEESHPIRFGNASIGNWDRPITGTESGIRNLNGQMAELMVFGAALSKTEIRKLALK